MPGVLSKQKDRGQTGVPGAELCRSPEGRASRSTSQLAYVPAPAPYGYQLPEDALQKLLPLVEVGRCQVSPERAYTNAAQVQAVVQIPCCTPGSLGKESTLESD